MCFKDNVFCAAWAEVNAIGEGLTWARKNNFSIITIESDCADIINRILKLNDDITITGFLLHKLNSKAIDFSFFNFNWCTNNSNRVADRLSKLSLTDHCNFYFDMDYSSSIQNDIISDSC